MQHCHWESFQSRSQLKPVLDLQTSYMIKMPDIAVDESHACRQGGGGDQAVCIVHRRSFPFSFREEKHGLVEAGSGPRLMRVPFALDLFHDLEKRVVIRQPFFGFPVGRSHTRLGCLPRRAFRPSEEIADDLLLVPGEALHQLDDAQCCRPHALKVVVAPPTAKSSDQGGSASVCFGRRKPL